jgi:hypothetical protein
MLDQSNIGSYELNNPLLYIIIIIIIGGVGLSP